MNRTRSRAQRSATRQRGHTSRAKQQHPPSRQAPSWGLIATGLIAVLAVALGGWWFSRSSTTDDLVLYRFQTDDIHSLAFDLADPDTIFFGHHGGISVSNDAGSTWRDGTLRGIDVMQQVIGLADSPRHYVAGHDGFSVSIDGGQTWNPQTSNLPSMDLHTFSGSPADPNRLYAIPAGLGLFTSIDGGATWSAATLPNGADTQPIAMAVAPNDPNTVYLARNGEVNVSQDAGKTWQEQPGPGGIIIALTVAPDAHETLYAGTNLGLFRRETDGQWTHLPIEPDGFVAAVAVSPARPDRVAIVDQRGNVYRSDNRGADWISN